jgi:hypothetical protein
MKLKRLLLLASAVLLHGCAITAASYAPSVDNLEAIKKALPKPANVGSFVTLPGMPQGTALSVRGNPMSSPVPPDYAAYLADALRRELTLAGRFDAKSTVEISGTLLKNDIAAGGFSTNSGEIEARFVVKLDGVERFQAVKRAQASWESSFVGAIAVPKAQQEYALLVQKLISLLLADAQFVAALR